jgi:hypothetical protein
VSVRTKAKHDSAFFLHSDSRSRIIIVT